MKKIITTLFIAGLIVSCNNESSGGVSTQSITELENDDQEAAYAYGMNIGQQVTQMNEAMKAAEEDSMDYKLIEKGLNDYYKLSKEERNSYAAGQNIGMSIDNFIKNQNFEGKMEPEFVIKGLMDVLNDQETLVEVGSINDVMNNYLMRKLEETQSDNIEKGRKFLEEKSAEANVQKTDSGLLYEVIEEGTGKQPTIESTVEVHYVGTTIDGKVFDQSRDNPIKFPLGNVIQGWQEGLQLMKEGAKYKLYIPSELAYGERGMPGSIEPNSVLIFEVELVSVE